MPQLDSLKSQNLCGAQLKIEAHGSVEYRVCHCGKCSSSPCGRFYTRQFLAKYLSAVRGTTALPPSSESKSLRLAASPLFSSVAVEVVWAEPLVLVFVDVRLVRLRLTQWISGSRVPCQATC